MVEKICGRDYVVKDPQAPPNLELNFDARVNRQLIRVQEIIELARKNHPTENENLENFPRGLEKATKESFLTQFCKL